MRSRLTTVLTVIGAVTVLVLAANTVALATTGKALIVGKTNTSSKITTIKRTTAGSGLQIITSSTSAPLVVSGKGKVKNLDADKVDGKEASSFQGKIGPLVWHDLALSSGWTGNCYDNAPQYAVRLGVVYLRGDVCNGTTGTEIFTLPAEARPVRTKGYIYLPIQQCDAGTGRIYISGTSGVATSASDPDHVGADACFTSLEGVSFTIS